MSKIIRIKGRGSSKTFDIDNTLRSEYIDHVLRLKLHTLLDHGNFQMFALKAMASFQHRVLRLNQSKVGAIMSQLKFN